MLDARTLKNDEFAAQECNLAAELKSVNCLMGVSAGRPVIIGFMRASDLCAISFADVLDETAGTGYQRRLNSRHSLDFRRYIKAENSTTIPLTFNLRPSGARAWSIEDVGDGHSRLLYDQDAGKLMAQVDCQHRLGHLSDLEVMLPFMSFIGLSVREEAEIFNVINSKAKGLSTSLLDFHDATLAEDLGRERPELYIAMLLRNEPTSPWYQQLDLGGTSTSGMERRASLRTVQKAIRRFLLRSKLLKTMDVDSVAKIVLNFWSAVALVLNDEWLRPRKHMVNKGVGVYALMDIAVDLVLEGKGHALDVRYFSGQLADFVGEFDWSSAGFLRGLGGEGGVREAVAQIRRARMQINSRAAVHG
jgi:DGQHR domain-containing protein